MRKEDNKLDFTGQDIYVGRMQFIFVIKPPGLTYTWTSGADNRCATGGDAGSRKR